jgi:tol-pal system protein YbgF
MTNPFVRTAAATLLAAALTLSATAQAQTSGARSGGLLDNLFGGVTQPPRDVDPGRTAQLSESDLALRLDRLESSIRQLTGAVEQLQHRNQLLEQALMRMQGETAFREGHAGPGTQQPVGTPRAPITAPLGGDSRMAPAPLPQTGRRSDVFDPSQHPNAPGAPRPLGGGLTIAGAEPGVPVAPPVGIAGGREAGAPLDLSTVARPGMPQPETVAGQPVLSSNPAGLGGLPPPPPRNTSATGVFAATQPATEAPSQSAKDEYDLAYGYLLRKDYALAEAAFQSFLRQHPGDRRVADATYWLAESLFQRQRYRDAAESYLTVTTKHEKSAKAPEALYRLGQSLAALGENEAACAALAEVGRKYPRASAGVKQGVDREQKRVRC